MSIKSVLEAGSLAPGTECGLGVIYLHHPLTQMGAVLGQSGAHWTSTDSSLYAPWPSATPLDQVSLLPGFLSFFWSFPYWGKVWIGPGSDVKEGGGQIPGVI